MALADEKVAGVLQAITWNEQGHIRGSFTFLENDEVDEQINKITIHFMNEKRETFEIRFNDVSVSSEPEDDVWVFSAKGIEKKAYK